MLDVAINILKTINEAGYEAYIVGGYVRNSLLGIDSTDIDITTNATPKELQEIFNEAVIPMADYGAVILNTNDYKFEITTFRREINYINNRKPIEVEYIKDLSEDLLRRDFTVNTICMDKDKNIIDLLNGKEDIDNRVIKTVLDPYYKFEEDALRILRAIRFATILDFTLDSELEKAILDKKSLLKNISYERKKEELDKIFSSVNSRRGIDLLLKYELDKELELDKLKDIEVVDSLMSVWSYLNVCEIYPFTNAEKDIIKNVNEAIKYDNYDKNVLYKYGLYVNQIAGSIKGLDKKIITENYNNLPIESRKDLDISSEDIISIIGKDPGEYIGLVYNDLEELVLDYKLNNNKDSLVKYIIENKNKY